MKNYVYQIDSLHTSNQILREENAEVRSQFRRIEQIKETLEQEKQNLEEKVTIASTLQAKDFVIEVTRNKGRKTRYAEKVEMISVCFQILENTIAEVGSKDIYMRIARPDELVLTHSEENLFLFEDKEIVYSARRTIEYDRKSAEICIFYENSSELIPGNYNVDIFAEGKLIGSSVFSLK
jgi:hypothetical protein